MTQEIVLLTVAIHSEHILEGVRERGGGEGRRGVEIKGEEKEGEFICTCVCMKVYMYICIYVCMFVAVVYMRKVANITVILLVQKCMRRVCVHTLVECLK